MVTTKNEVQVKKLRIQIEGATTKINLRKMVTTKIEIKVEGQVKMNLREVATTKIEIQS